MASSDGASTDVSGETNCVGTPSKAAVFEYNEEESYDVFEPPAAPAVVDDVPVATYEELVEQVGEYDVDALSDLSDSRLMGGEDDDAPEDDPEMYRVSPSTTWREEDEQKLQSFAVRLAKSVEVELSEAEQSSTGVPAAVMVTSQGSQRDKLADPLGLGSIDPSTLLLEREVELQENELRQAIQEGGLDARLAHFQGTGGREVDSAKGAAVQMSVGSHSMKKSFHWMSKEPRDAPGSGHKREGSTMLSRAQIAEQRKYVLPNAANFDPERYLAQLHRNTSMEELQEGLLHLHKEVRERNNQLMDLVRNNFQRFISCKNSIDDIHVKLQQSEDDNKTSTSRLAVAISAVHEEAQRVFGPMLARQQKLEQIRSVLAMLKRFDALFSIPSSIRDCQARGELDQVVDLFRKAKSLMLQMDSASSRIWKPLYAEVEKALTQVMEDLLQQLEKPRCTAAQVLAAVTFITRLQCEGLGSAANADPLGSYSACFRSWVESELHMLARQQEDRRHLIQESGTEAEKAWQHLQEDGGRWQMMDLDMLLQWQEAHSAPASAAPPSGADADADAGCGAWPGCGRAAASAQRRSGFPASCMPWGGTRVATLGTFGPEHARAIQVEQEVLPSVRHLLQLIQKDVVRCWKVASSRRLTLLHGELEDASEAAKLGKQRLAASLEAAKPALGNVVALIVRQMREVASSLFEGCLLRPCVQHILQEMADVIATLRAAELPEEMVREVENGLEGSLGCWVGSMCRLMPVCIQRLERQENWIVSSTCMSELSCSRGPRQMAAVFTEIADLLHDVVALALQHVSLPVAKWRKEVEEAMTGSLRILAERLLAQSQELSAELLRQGPYNQTRRLGSRPSTPGSPGALSDGGDASPTRLRSVGSGLAATGAAGSSCWPEPQLDASARLLVLMCNSNYLRRAVLPKLPSQPLQGLQPGSASAAHGPFARPSEGIAEVQKELEELEAAMVQTYLDVKADEVEHAVEGMLFADGVLWASAPFVGDRAQVKVRSSVKELVHLVVGITGELVLQARAYLPRIVPGLVRHMLQCLLHHLEAIPTLSLGGCCQLYLEVNFLEMAVQAHRVEALDSLLDTIYERLLSAILDLLKAAMAPTDAQLLFQGADSLEAADAVLQRLCADGLKSAMQGASVNLRSLQTTAAQATPAPAPLPAPAASVAAGDSDNARVRYSTLVVGIDQQLLASSNDKTQAPLQGTDSASLGSDPPSSDAMILQSIPLDGGMSPHPSKLRPAPHFFK